MTKIVALHGFLGRPQDWDIFDFPFSVDKVDIFKGKMISFKEWAREFNARHHDSDIIMGYSLGARLAMHAVLESPGQWKGMILISGHPGLDGLEERQERLESDQTWGRRFVKDPWKEVVNAWNGQAVFGGKSSFERREGDFNKEALASSLDVWSLGRQENLKEELAGLDLPILYIAGSLDEKCSSLVETLRFKHTRSKVIVVNGCYHRVPWEDPENFTDAVRQFL